MKVVLFPVIFSLVLLGTLKLFAPFEPFWWDERGVLDEHAASDDYAVINQGQVKNLAEQAYNELEASVPGGAGVEISSLIEAWIAEDPDRDDFVAVNVGQLKSIAEPFYERLIEIGYLSEFPWDGQTSTADDYALANIGQAKRLFSFDLSNHVIVNEIIGEYDATIIEQAYPGVRIGNELLDRKYEIPKSAWFDLEELEWPYDPNSETLSFNVRGAAASIDEDGTIISKGEGVFSIEVRVLDENGDLTFLQMFNGFENRLLGERKLEITYFYDYQAGQIVDTQMAYGEIGGSHRLSLDEWIDSASITELSNISGASFDWLDVTDADSLSFQTAGLSGSVASVQETTGDLVFVDEGEGNLSIRPENPNDPLQWLGISITNYFEGLFSVVRRKYIPDPLDISDHVLVVYNGNSQDSEDLKDYYIQNRPGFQNANVLEINCSSDEVIYEVDYISDVETPIVDWLTTTEKPIRYIVLLLDIPTRVHTQTLVGSSVSYRIVQSLSESSLREGEVYYDESFYHYLIPTYFGTAFTLEQFKGMTALVTHLNMGELSACKAYIDKISSFSETNGVLHPVDANYANRFYMEDHDSSSQISDTFIKGRYKDRMLIGLSNLSENNVIYQAKGDGFIASGDNVAFFATQGVWGQRGADYAIDQQIQWGVDSDWWIMMSTESYNGQITPEEHQGSESIDPIIPPPMAQGNYIDWFSAEAFGGTGYSRTPVGAVCHVDEPLVAGLSNWGFPGMWHEGFTFAEAAWLSRHTRRFMAVGDPLVARIPPESN